MAEIEKNETQVNDEFKVDEYTPEDSQCSDEEVDQVVRNTLDLVGDDEYQAAEPPIDVNDVDAEYHEGTILYTHPHEYESDEVSDVDDDDGPHPNIYDDDEDASDSNDVEWDELIENLADSIVKRVKHQKTHKQSNCSDYDDFDYAMDMLDELTLSILNGFKDVSHELKGIKKELRTIGKQSKKDGQSRNRRKH